MSLDHRQQQYLDAMGISCWEARPGFFSEQKNVSLEPLLVESRPSERLEEQAIIDKTAVAADAFRDPHREASEQQTDKAKWEMLVKKVSHCQQCHLSQTRINTVFGVGDQRANCMVIGEAPGADEDKQGQPFVGRAGKLLDEMLFAVGFKREQVFIANILKCRPPGNRDPRPEEVAECNTYLLQQIKLIQPKVILSVGRISTQNLLNSKEKIGRLRGQVHYFGALNIPLVATYHPAYLLRSPSEKRKSWQDLLRVLAILNN